MHDEKISAQFLWGDTIPYIHKECPRGKGMQKTFLDEEFIFHLKACKKLFFHIRFDIIQISLLYNIKILIVKSSYALI